MRNSGDVIITMANSSQITESVSCFDVTPFRMTKDTYGLPRQPVLKAEVI